MEIFNERVYSECGLALLPNKVEILTGENLCLLNDIIQVFL
jgi:hypothetical protein